MAAARSENRDLTNGAHRIELGESSLRVPAKFFHRVAVVFPGLPLHLSQSNGLKPRFLFQYSQGVACFHASDLFGIAAEDHPQGAFFCQSQQVRHLTRRNHASLVEDDYLASDATANARVLQQPLDGDGVGETDLLQFLDSAHRRSDGKHITAASINPRRSSCRRCGLAGPCRATDAHRQVARSENEFHGMLLFGAQTVRDDKRMSATERLECRRVHG